MFDPYFERIAAWATTERFAAEVSAARQAFFDGTGRVHEDDRSFETRMSAFSEWYLFDRALGDDPLGRPPARVFLDEQGAALGDEERPIFEDLTRTRAGLFEIRKVKDAVVVVRDLLEEEDLPVDERRRLPGLGKGDLVQARLVPYAGMTLFGRTFVFHPREARRLVLKAVKQRRKEGALDGALGRRDLLWRLARTALLLERQQTNNRAGASVERVYGAL